MHVRMRQRRANVLVGCARTVRQSLTGVAMAPASIGRVHLLASRDRAAGLSLSAALMCAVTAAMRDPVGTGRMMGLGFGAQVS
jgi:hypothetical protein